MRPKTEKKSETVVPAKLVKLANLKAHPRNYRGHPDDQLVHIVKSIRENGFYRNVVAAKDLTILAGHGVVAAARKMELEKIPVVVLNIDPFCSRALRLLAGDNEISHLTELDDRTLTGILKDLRENDAEGLLGTGFDDAMLANLLFITRPASEIKDKNDAAAWVGMPEYGVDDERIKMVVTFASMEDRARFANVLGLKITDQTLSVWWPPEKRISSQPSDVEFKGQP